MSTAAVWWNRELVNADEAHRELSAFAEALQAEQGEVRRSRASASLFLYYGNARRGVGSMLSPLVGDFTDFDAPPFYNVVQSITDTITNHTVRNKVRPLFVPDGGDTELKDKAQGMQLGVEGEFIASGLWSTLGQYIALDGGLHDAGVVKILPDFANNRPICERVFAWEILIPEAEARLGNPRQFIHRTLVPRDVLAAMFPEWGDEIRDTSATPAASPEWGYEGIADGLRADLVAVYDGYHLPSGFADLTDPKSFGLTKKGEYSETLSRKPGHDGRQTIAINGKTLRDRPWPYPYPPFAFYRPHPDAVGFWSTPIPERLAGAQMELMKIGKRVSALLHLHAVPRIIVARGAKINISKLSNDYATVLESNHPPGSSVMYLQPHSVPSELLEQQERIIAWCEREFGLSEMSIAAAKPAGIEHAPALEFLADHESLRHTIRHRQWNDFFVQCARLYCDAFHQLSEENPKFELMWADSNELKRVNWKQTELARYKYNLKVWDTNILAQRPEARLNQLLSIMDRGVPIAQTALAEAMGDSLDFRALVGNVTAMQRNVEARLAKASKEGYSEDVAPHPYMDLAECKRLAREKINELEAKGVEDSKIEPLRDFWEHAHLLEQTAIAEANRVKQGIPPTGAPGAGGPPPGAAPPPGAGAPPPGPPPGEAPPVAA